MAQRRKSMNNCRGKRMNKSIKRRMRGGEDAVAPTVTYPAAPAPAPAPTVTVTDPAPTVTDPSEEVSPWDKITGVFSNTESKLNEGANMVEGKLDEGVNALQAKVAEGTSMIKQATNNISGNNPEQNPAAETPAVETPAVEEKKWYEIWKGGRRRCKSRSMKMKGGKSNLGLSYYATPVTDANVAQPTYMMKYTGGRRRKSCKICKRKSCRICKRKSCKKSCRITHRHR
jgi:hypothetical protein